MAFTPESIPWRTGSIVQVLLDKDDTAATNADGSIPCLAYLPGSDGKPNLN
jgi:hypothetical protein